MAVNTFCHVEFDVTDLARAQEFYGGMFQWTFRAFGDEMVVFGNGTDHLGGLMKKDKVESGSSPSVWIEADLLENYLEKAPKHGGSVVSGRSEIPGVGWSAVVKDPDGNPIGLVQFAGK